MKVACTVWNGEKSGDYFKGLLIVVKSYPNAGELNALFHSYAIPDGFQKTMKSAPFMLKLWLLFLIFIFFYVDFNPMWTGSEL